MSNRLSNSQISKAMLCQESYNLWYNKRLRPTKSRGALMFGSAFDKATDVLLKPEEHKNTTAEKVFEDLWLNQNVNDVLTYLPTNTNIMYAKTDFDGELITDKDLKELGITRDAMYALAERRNEKGGFERLTEEEKALANHIFWMSLKRKGLIFIDSFRKKVLPKITKVLATQKFIELNNGEDTVIGYIDVVAEYEGYYVPIVFDIKTSAMAYEEDSVIFSEQLVLYTHAVEDEYKTDMAGFIVMNKNIKKNKVKTCSSCGNDGTGTKFKTCNREMGDGRCNKPWIETISPEAYVQIIIDKIPSKTTDLVLENIDGINQSIKTGHFTKNLHACQSTFGGNCDYIDYCYKGLMTNLTKKEG